MRARVRFVRDETIARIVANWPRAATARRAERLGLAAESDFAGIIRRYIADCRAGGDVGRQALAGLEPA